MTNPLTMIDLYTWSTPNGHKVQIALEELELPYEVHAVDIAKGAQFEPEFLAISPNNKIPAIVDRDGPGGAISVFESGAILLYLAEKTGKLAPTDARGRVAMHEWLMFQMASVGPMLGQLGHFTRYAPEKIPYAIDRYTNEAKRIFHVVDARLEKSEFLAGPEYGIADIATFPWLRLQRNTGLGIAELPHVARWLTAIEARPAVRRGLDVLKTQRTPEMDDKAREILFGKTQYERRR